MQRIGFWLIATILRAIGNYIDKYMLSKFFHTENNLSILMIFSSIVWIFILPIIYLFNPDILNISNPHKIILIISGLVYIISLIPYLYALKKDETSNIVPLFQMIPAISLALWYIFLKEIPTLQQIIWFIIIFTWSIVLSLDLKNNIKFNTKTFLLMFLSCLLLSSNYLVFKIVQIDAGFRTTAFWEYIWWGIMWIILLLIPWYAKSFFRLFKQHKTKIISLNFTNEALNIIAKLILSYIITITFLWFAPLVNWFQPFIIFIIGILFTFLFPKYIKEKYSKKIIIQKILCFVFMLIWLILL